MPIRMSFSSPPTKGGLTPTKPVSMGASPRAAATGTSFSYSASSEGTAGPSEGWSSYAVELVSDSRTAECVLSVSHEGLDLEMPNGQHKRWAFTRIQSWGTYAEGFFFAFNRVDGQGQHKLAMRTPDGKAIADACMAAATSVVENMIDEELLETGRPLADDDEGGSGADGVSIADVRVLVSEEGGGSSNSRFGALAAAQQQQQQQQPGSEPPPPPPSERGYGHRLTETSQAAAAGSPFAAGSSSAGSTAEGVQQSLPSVAEGADAGEEGQAEATAALEEETTGESSPPRELAALSRARAPTNDETLRV